MSRSTIERAAEPVDVITRQSRTNFYYSFLILPARQRKAIETVYAFCRLMDDIVDEDVIVDDARLELLRWREEISNVFSGAPHSYLGRTLKEVVAEFPIPERYFQELITGMEMDLEQRRYRDFAELERYCYHVAGVTGLMCIEIFGYREASARDYAVKLGSALQLVNIMRDLKEDAARGRVYLPQTEMAEFGYREEDLLNCHYNENFTALMEFQCQRARNFFSSARATLAPVDRSSMLAAEIMGGIYARILDRIEAGRFNVFGERISLSKFEKVMAALQAWRQSRRRA
jgi:15-cis-phytoene synthase